MKRRQRNVAFLVVSIISQADIAQHDSENAGTGERRAVSDVRCAVSEPSESSYR